MCTGFNKMKDTHTVPCIKVASSALISDSELCCFREKFTPWWYAASKEQVQGT